mmetsp:Transcript_48874/g.163111  ORF Transcript_48874/g.163111 Transcript_48874/m.163111 type:complete len:257 (-) Transcript_48874:293-1063(-)
MWHAVGGRVDPRGHNVAKDAARDGVEAELERRRDEHRRVRDLKDGLETDALAANLAAAGRLTRLADLAHGVQVLGLEAALVVPAAERLIAALDVQLRRLAALGVVRAVVRVLDDLVYDARARRVDLARERLEAVFDRPLVFVPAGQLARRHRRLVRQLEPRERLHTAPPPRQVLPREHRLERSCARRARQSSGGGLNLAAGAAGRRPRTGVSRRLRGAHEAAQLLELVALPPEEVADLEVFVPQRRQVVRRLLALL